MGKVVIVSKQKNCNNGLITLIGALFPECEISVVFSDIEGIDVYPDESLSEFPLTDVREGTMSDILIMHYLPSMHELFSQELAGAVKSLMSGSDAESAKG